MLSRQFLILHYPHTHVKTKELSTGLVIYVTINSRVTVDLGFHAIKLILVYVSTV